MGIQRVEEEIFELETEYLQRTRSSGNLIIGFDKYITDKALLVHQNAPPNRSKPPIEHRLFSLSSISSPTSLELLRKKKYLPRHNSTKHAQNCTLLAVKEEEWSPHPKRVRPTEEGALESEEMVTE